MAKEWSRCKEVGQFSEFAVPARCVPKRSLVLTWNSPTVGRIELGTQVTTGGAVVIEESGRARLRDRQRSALKVGARRRVHLVQEPCARIERMEERKGVGKPAKLTIVLFDSVVDGTITDEEFAHYVPALYEAFPDAVQDIATDICV